MNLIKIGGAVLKDKTGFERLVDIINNHAEYPLLIVVSAFSTATRRLEKAARLARKGFEKEASDILESVIEEHYNYANELLNDGRYLNSLKIILDESSVRIRQFFRGLNITRELTPRTLDAILSFGEYFAVHTVSHFLQEQGYAHGFVNATDIIVTDDNHGKASPLNEETQICVNTILLPALEKNKLVVTQGFVAKNSSGDITTMGIESSNLTAVLLAETLHIDTITFWTDVEGICSADPKIASDTMPIAHLSYEQSYAVALDGLKLIYPSAIEYARKEKIKMVYRSAFNPAGNFTVIDSNKCNFSKIITSKDGFTSIKFTFDSLSTLNIIKEFIDKSNLIYFNDIYFDLAPNSLKLILQSSLLSSLKIPRGLSHSLVEDLSIIAIHNINHKEIMSALLKINSDYEFITIKIDGEKSMLPIHRIIIPQKEEREFIELLHKELIVKNI